MWLLVQSAAFSCGTSTARKNDPDGSSSQRREGRAGVEARDEPFNAFPSSFLRIECDRCDKVQMVNEAHFARPKMPIRAILAKMRHDGCGGRVGRAELITGIEGVSSRLVRRIVLREG